MKFYKTELHVHTVLSPCANLLMTPASIINRAIKAGIEILAITDHNSAENVEVTLKLAKNTPLQIIPGMELETREEVHLLCLFDRLEQVICLQNYVYESLPDLKNREDVFGYQLLTDLEDEYKAKIDRLLAVSTTLTINDAVKTVNDLGGIVIPAHVDRNNGLIKNLGFIPSDLNLPVLEISNNTDCDKLNINGDENYKIIKNSDSHFIHELKPWTTVELRSISVKEILQAIILGKTRKLLF